MSYPITLRDLSPPAAARPGLVWTAGFAASGRKPRRPHQTACEAPLALTSLERGTRRVIRMTHERMLKTPAWLASCGFLGWHLWAHGFVPLAATGTPASIILLFLFLLLLFV